MPRAHCKACGKKFSADAEKCPHCGEIVTGTVGPGIILMAMAGVIVVIFVLMSLFQ